MTKLMTIQYDNQKQYFLTVLNLVDGKQLSNITVQVTTVKTIYSAGHALFFPCSTVNAQKRVPREDDERKD
jgi:hypothetical protein